MALFCGVKVLGHPKASFKFRGIDFSALHYVAFFLAGILHLHTFPYPNMEIVQSDGRAMGVL